LVGAHETARKITCGAGEIDAAGEIDRFCHQILCFKI
jgi:hypothetical protein